MDSSRSKLRSKFSRPFFSFNNPLHKKETTSAKPIINMAKGTTLKSDDDLHTWTTSATHSQVAPAIAPETLSYSVPADSSSQPSLESTISFQPMSCATPSRPISSQAELQTPASIEDNFYVQKPYEDQFVYQNMSSDIPIGQAFTSDEAIPIIDLDSHDPSHPGYHYQVNYNEPIDPRRISGSSFTMSTSGAPSDIHPYEDFSTAMSDAPSFCSDYPPPSNRNSWMSLTHLSPVPSPRMSSHCRSELVRTQSRGRASPSPRPSARSAPYSIDVPRSSKRWSTGSYATPSNRRSAPFMYQVGPEANSMHPATTQAPCAMPCQPRLQRSSMFLPTQLPSQLHSHHPLHGEIRPYDAPPLLSHGLFRMLQSNADAHSLHRRYAELSDPPDLFGSLGEEQPSPPEEDMNPADPDMIPREQDLRFDGDLYTPRWVRGHGNKREGWCGICKPGRWLVLKNSAYWYDKSFSHGVSAATGAPFHEPLDTRRMDGNPDVWEGLCNSCNDWVALVSSKKKGTTWFRHAYKCHSHPKAKDGAKRRRESSHTRASMANSAPKAVKTEAHSQQLANPLLTPSSATHTPITGAIHPAITQLQPPPTLLSSDMYSSMI